MRVSWSRGCWVLLAVFVIASQSGCGNACLPPGSRDQLSCGNQCLSSCPGISGSALQSCISQCGSDGCPHCQTSSSTAVPVKKVTRGGGEPQEVKKILVP